MLERLKIEVFEANMLLPKLGLVTFTWGNASGIDRGSGVVVIKPSGVEYDAMRPEDMVAVRLADGKVIEGALNPSSDTATHLALYRAFGGIGGVVHTHSRYATVMAQAGLPIRSFGTTHADYFYGDVPCTRTLTDGEINGDYEHNTGAVIAETFAGKDPLAVPAALVKSHGPFIWGESPKKAAENAAVLEEIAFMALQNLALNPNLEPVTPTLLDRHFLRKHGAGAYYGQPKK